MKDDEIILDDDIIMPDEDIIMPEEEVTPTEKPGEEQKVDQPKAQEPEDEDKKILDYLNGKGLVKFNGENVQIKDLNDLVTNYQKGLNYDKHTEDDKIALDYIKEKASVLGISPKEYIGRVKNYEEQKKKEAQEAEIQRRINAGQDEAEAREIVQTRIAREEFEKEKAEYQKRIADDEKKKKEDAEYLEFVKAHPDVKIDEIPQEVFEQAEKIGINAAYNIYQVKILKEENERLKQAQQNASSSPVSLASDGGTTEQTSKDAFLEGFDSVE